MKILIFCVALAALALSSSRAHAAGAPASIAAQAPIVTWKDSEQKTLFTSDDILFFDWENQYFLLKDAAFQNYLRWIEDKTLTKEIAVEDKDGLIYQARWEFGASSMGHFFPTYYPRKGPRFDSRATIYITDGYPNDWTPLIYHAPDDSPASKDSRNSERLRADLQAVGVLKPQEKNAPPVDYSPYSLPVINAQWRDFGLDTHVGVQCYGASFQSGSQPRVDFLFTKGFNLEKQADALAVENSFRRQQRPVPLRHAHRGGRAQSHR